MFAKIKGAVMGLSVFAKVAGIALGVTFFLAAGLFWQIHHAYATLERMEVEDHAHYTARVLATALEPLLRAHQLDQLREHLGRMAEISPNLNTVEIRDREGRIVAQTPPFSPDAKLIPGAARLPEDIGGSLNLTMTDAHVDFELGWHTRRLLATTCVIALLGCIASWWLTRIVTRPISELVQLVGEVNTGNYEVRATVRARDEIGVLTGAFNQMIATLRQKEAANHQLLRSLITAEEEERKRVARELHDHTGQALTSLIASLAALKSKNHDEKLSDLLALATQTLSEVHDLSRALRPSTLDELGLVPALQKFCETVARRVGVSVDFATVGLEANARLPAPVEVALYRIGQEALTNAVQHGQARSIEVLLQRKTESVLMVVEDDGQGFPAQEWRAECLKKGRLGLLGIEERAVQLGGNLRVESRPGSGTSLFVEIPIPSQKLDA